MRRAGQPRANLNNNMCPRTCASVGVPTHCLRGCTWNPLTELPDLGWDVLQYMMSMCFGHEVSEDAVFSAGSKGIPSTVMGPWRVRFEANPSIAPCLGGYKSNGMRDEMGYYVGIVSINPNINRSAATITIAHELMHMFIHVILPHLPGEVATLKGDEAEMMSHIAEYIMFKSMKDDDVYCRTCIPDHCRVAYWREHEYNVHYRRNRYKRHLCSPGIRMACRKMRIERFLDELLARKGN